MKITFKIARMELQKMFYSPIAWFILIVFAVQAGMQLTQIIGRIVVETELGHPMQALTSRIFTGSSGVLNGMQGYLYLYIPLLTMGLLSREFSSGSIKLLYSSPISNKQIVLGKFISMMIFGLAMIFILFITVILGSSTIKDFDFPLVLTAILGLYLVICAYSAIGLFMSSLTSYQIVAALGTFTTLFVLQQMGRVWQDVEFVKDITYWLSINGRSDTFIGGLICSEDLLYFILVPGLFIAFTIFRLKGIREKSPRYVSFARYAGAFMIVSLIGYVSTIPSLMKYHDSTRTNTNTLTENSQEVISKLKGKLTITAYTNIFDQNFMFGKPVHQKFYIGNTFEKYRRFYPNMKIKFKYYHAIPVEEWPLKHYNMSYKGLTAEEALKKACNVSDLNTKRFKPGTDYLNEIDLRSELNRFVNKLSLENGKTAYIRLYNDAQRLPGESQITVAFKKLIMELPLIGFVKGHEERDVNDFGSRGYFSLAKEKPFRWSLINNGFDFTECVLSRPVDKDIDILVIAESKTAFSEEERKNLDDYIDRGGNLIIACDRKRQDNMNPLVERFGVKFLPGQVVEYNKGYDMSLVSSLFTEEGKKINYLFEFASQNSGCVTMPDAVAVSYKNKGEFKYIPLLVSDTVKNTAQLDSLGSWNELKTTDFIDNVAKYNPEDGEALGSLTTALALGRKVGEREQKIMILGDADCFSNGEISRNRAGIHASNFVTAMGVFCWLSDNEVPIDIRRPAPPDNKTYLEKKDMPLLNALYKIIIPILIALVFLLIWLRRKGR